MGFAAQYSTKWKQRFWSRSVVNNSNIKGMTVSWFHSKGMVIGHQAGISKSTYTKTIHCSITYTSGILVILLCRGFLMDFYPWDFPMSILQMSSWHSPAYTPHILQGMAFYQRANLNRRIWPYLEGPCESTLHIM